MAREQRETKGDVEKISGGDNPRIELGPSHEVGSGQETLAFFGSGLMCDHTHKAATIYINPLRVVSK